MDICIGGILDGQKIENHNDVFKIEEHYSDNSSQYVKQHFHLFGKILPFGCAKILIYNRQSEKLREF